MRTTVAANSYLFSCVFSGFVFFKATSGAPRWRNRRLRQGATSVMSRRFNGLGESESEERKGWCFIWQICLSVYLFIFHRVWPSKFHTKITLIWSVMRFSLAAVSMQTTANYTKQTKVSQHWHHGNRNNIIQLTSPLRMEEGSQQGPASRQKPMMDYKTLTWLWSSSMWKTFIH